MADCLLIDKMDGYAVVTLNRPEALNALSKALQRAISDMVDELETDPDVRAIILTGAGRAFCAGVDLKELTGAGSELDEEGGLWSAESLNPVTALDRFSGPIIAAVNGVAVTGGFELVLASDVIIASETARFADTHARVGIYPGGGVSQRLSRAIGIYRAKELSLTGNFLSAERAERWGLVNRVVKPDDLMETAKAIVGQMLTLDDAMLKGYKKLIDDGFAASFGDAMAHEEAVARRTAGQTTSKDMTTNAAAVFERGRANAAKS